MRVKETACKLHNHELLICNPEEKDAEMLPTQILC